MPPPPLKLRRSRSAENRNKGLCYDVSFIEHMLQSNYVTAFIAWNITACLLRHGSDQFYKIMLIVTNLAL